jgi:hypothetical protein
VFVGEKLSIILCVPISRPLFKIAFPTTETGLIFEPIPVKL